MSNDINGKMLLRSTYAYELPTELIAQHPSEKRDTCRLLVCRDGELDDKIFTDIQQYFDKGDVLVVNKSKVIPARVFFLPISEKRSGMVELLLMKDMGGGIWECLARPGKRAKPGDRLRANQDQIGNSERPYMLEAEVLSVTPEGNRIVKFSYDTTRSFLSLLDEVGRMPLPPYITEKLDDNSKYQTVYAKEYGSAAAPTAGLHFTEELLAALKKKGVEIAEVILHVGLGTFRPVKEDNILNHHMHSEYYEIPRDAADAINGARHRGKRVVAVGTTSVRTMEGAYARFFGSEPGHDLPACSGETNIFIYPGFRFMTSDALITNFHLPESTLIMLVSAFYGYERTMEAYRHAIVNRYRFFSFGDAMYLERRSGEDEKSEHFS
ncbi:MAG: tRNA preQ1(34) S-adenosylmethionine ribosyltransferase-isomerase QueA [Oscillospiraceae bacterium]|nr:tRNA preQ1(34) S-adenosylmethionine ribosyltransferase-isomerase QueA [Oscillospiraceae bacterium]